MQDSNRTSQYCNAGCCDCGHEDILEKRIDNVYSGNMSENDNSVNIDDEIGRYHHGDLRAALIAEGLRLLATSDVEHMSLREIARNVGVSATAVYRHFPDKNALLGALAASGGEQLADQQLQAQRHAGGGIEGFNATGRVYVRFALANPALFRLMMSNAREGSESDSEKSTGLGLLRRNIAMLAGPEANENARRVRAIQSWAIVHGLAMLMLDGQVPPDEMLIEEVVNSGAMHAGG